MARPRKFDDEQVLDRATELFWKDGADSVSIRDLETALELKAPSIYRRFGSKDRLLDACLHRYIDRSVGSRIRFFLTAEDPLAGLRAFFASVLEPHPGESKPRGCLLTNTAGQLGHTLPQAQRTINLGFDRIQGAFQTQLERAQAQGQLSATADADAVAWALLLSFQGLLIMARAGTPELHRTIDATFDVLAMSPSLDNNP